MFIGFTLYVDFIMVLFLIDTQKLLEMAATNFIAGIGGAHRVPVHSIKLPWRLLITCTRC
jgi:hypothetical protein